MIVRWGTQFHDRLDALTDRLASMSHLAGEAIEIATDAVVHADLPLAERVFDLNEQVEARVAHARTRRWRCWRLQAPVARDLRQVITGVHLVADPSRMGGLAQHVAESVRRRRTRPTRRRTRCATPTTRRADPRPGLDGQHPGPRSR
ncbi:PhoU domain-containing protein [Rhodococcus opacus]|uniref:PhoU domain-containing protein n=2 Tax=Rhodococcus opacus TaxID=37919 RepID=UPI002877EDF5|nr:PhoU domain-containing protein [Rhodococcus opacus]